MAVVYLPTFTLNVWQMQVDIPVPWILWVCFGACSPKEHGSFKMYATFPVEVELAGEYCVPILVVQKTIPFPTNPGSLKLRMVSARTMPLVSVIVKTPIILWQYDDWGLGIGKLFCFTCFFLGVLLFHSHRIHGTGTFPYVIIKINEMQVDGR